MIKCLFADSTFQKGHKGFNAGILKALSSLSDVDLYVLDYSGYYKKDCFSNKIKWIDYIGKNGFDSRLLGRLESIRVLNFVKRENKKHNFDYIIMASYDIVSLFFSGYCLKNTYLINHNNIDQLKNRAKRRMFKTISKHFSHVVLEGFIDAYLKNNFRNIKTHLVHHPLPACKKNNDCKCVYDCVALSNNNDETIIDRLIEFDKNNILKEKNLRIVIKSHRRNYKSDNLYVIKGFLDDACYGEFLSSSKYVYLPYPKSYMYRTSAVFLEAIVNKKKIISSDILLASYYKQLYPNLVYVCEKADDLLELLSKRGDDDYKDDASDFIKNRSDLQIAKELLSLFKK